FKAAECSKHENNVLSRKTLTAWWSRDLASAKRVEGSFKVPTPKVSSMMASVDEDVEKSSLSDQDDVKSGRDTPFSRVRSASSRSGGRSQRPLNAKNSQLSEDEEADEEKFINPEITESMRLEIEYDAKVFT
ncbi:hypothetical protein Tco_0746159, partial [Tanacetum coccineum]